jgi:hypothetical protein
MADKQTSLFEAIAGIIIAFAGYTMIPSLPTTGAIIIAAGGALAGWAFYRWKHTH